MESRTEHKKTPSGGWGSWSKVGVACDWLQFVGSKQQVEREEHVQNIDDSTGLRAFVRRIADGKGDGHETPEDGQGELACLDPPQNQRQCCREKDERSE